MRFYLQEFSENSALYSEFCKEVKVFNGDHCNRIRSVRVEEDTELQASSLFVHYYKKGTKFHRYGGCLRLTVRSMNEKEGQGMRSD